MKFDCPSCDTKHSKFKEWVPKGDRHYCVKKNKILQKIFRCDCCGYLMLYDVRIEVATDSFVQLKYEKVNTNEASRNS